jgi:hypothetical protein
MGYSISQSKVTRRRGEDRTDSTASHADTVNFDFEMELLVIDGNIALKDPGAGNV